MDGPDDQRDRVQGCRGAGREVSRRFHKKGCVLGRWSGRTLFESHRGRMVLLLEAEETEKTPEHGRGEVGGGRVWWKGRIRDCGRQTPRDSEFPRVTVTHTSSGRSEGQWMEVYR